ncbi:MAG TPA: zinc ABC transporter substrate-binding protein [Jatrophihabitans sp.]|nr:zinc ABC transporter substrate-binding protein [Jatrophihabitans sp.]
MQRRRTPARLRAATLLALLLLGGPLAAGCATTPPPRTGPLIVGASINVWGSLLAQLGGAKVRATSIIDNPATDPHDFEPTPSDAKLIALSAVFVENGIGYDTWAGRTVRANPDARRQLVDVGQVTGTPADGNPHRWYSPSDVGRVADAITTALQRADPADAGYFAQRRQAFEQDALARYHQLIASIRTEYAGTPVGASESIVSPLAAALGLRLLTPPSFLRAISEGTDPSAADKASIDTQLSRRQLAVYLFNSQNSVPDVAGQVAQARRQGIPVVNVTETLSPRGSTFQDWQVRQLTALAAALAKATGRTT